MNNFNKNNVLVPLWIFVLSIAWIQHCLIIYIRRNILIKIYRIMCIHNKKS